MAWWLSWSSASSLTSSVLISISTSCKNCFQKAGVTDALSMECFMHDNPFEEDDMWYAHQIWSYFVSVVFRLLS